MGGVPATSVGLGPGNTSLISRSQFAGRPVPKQKMEAKKAVLKPAPSLIFPSDLPMSHSMEFSFSMNQYRRKRYVKESFDTMSLMLPVPTNLVDSLQASYNEVEMGTVGGAIVEQLTRNGMTADDISNAVSTTFKNIYEAGQMTGEMITGEKSVGSVLTNLSGSSTAAIIANTFRQRQDAIGVGLGRFFGAAPDPYVTAMFRGMALRSHNFSWKLSPASENESKSLFRIVRGLKKSLVPARNSNKVSLEYPDEVQIRFMSNWLNEAYEFKTCVLRNVSINYAPDGVPSFFADEAHRQPPTAIQLTLDFLETEIHTREDIGNTG